MPLNRIANRLSEASDVVNEAAQEQRIAERRSRRASVRRRLIARRRTSRRRQRASRRPERRRNRRKANNETEALKSFFDKMMRGIPYRPDLVEEGPYRIYVEWDEGPNVNTWATLEVVTHARGAGPTDVSAKVDGVYYYDPREAAEAVTDWIDLLFEERG